MELSRPTQHEHNTPPSHSTKTWRENHLGSAMELGVFWLLDKKPLSASDLAQSLRIPLYRFAQIRQRTRLTFPLAYPDPAGDQERSQVREICRQILAFENYYLRCYRVFLLSELQSGNSSYQFLAVDQLNKIVYPDDEIQAALRSVNLDG